MVGLALAMFLCSVCTNHGFFNRLVISGWAASGVIGIACVFIGSGGVSKQPIDTWGNLALALHICSLGFLMLLGALAASGNT